MANERDREFLEAFGIRLKQLRIQRGLSELDLARRIDQSPDFISLLESGEKDANMSTLLALADALEVNPQDLL